MPGWRCERGCSLLEGHDIFTTPDAPALCGKHQGRGAHGDSEGNPGQDRKKLAATLHQDVESLKQEATRNDAFRSL